MPVISTQKPGLSASMAVHLAVLVFSLVAFSNAKPLPASEESIAVEMITDNQLSQITKGEKQAKEVNPEPKPRAERVAEVTEQKDPGEAKHDAPAPPKRPADVTIADKPVETAAAAPPQLKRETPPPVEAPKAVPPSRRELAALAEKAEQEEAKEEAEALRQAKALQAKLEAKAQAEAKAKVEAEAKVKAEAQAANERKLAAAKAAAAREAAAKDAAAKEAKAQKDAQIASKFDAGDIRRLLQSKEQSQSTGSTGREVNRTASLGTATGSAQKLNPSQRDALIGVIQEQLHRCWSVPIAVQSAPKPPVASLKIRLNQDGSLSAEPAVLNPSSDALFKMAADSAARAARRCAPLSIPAKFQPYYQDWKELTVNFNPSDMG
jgi:colicin import membrane protein